MGGILFLVKAILKIVQLLGLADRLGVFELIKMLEEQFGEAETTTEPAADEPTTVA